MRFGERLRALRKLRGLTQARVAEAAGITTRAYSSYERKDKRPRHRETYTKLAEVLGCSVNDLLMEDTPLRSEESDAGTADSAIRTLLPTSAMSAGALVAAGIPLAIASPAGPAVAIAVTAAASGLAGGIAHSISSQARPASYAEEVLREYRRASKTFAMMSRGLINAALDEAGIQHSMSIRPDDAIDDALTLDAEEVNTWWICYYGGNNPTTEPIPPDIKAQLLVGRFLHFKPDPLRKASVVVDNSELYQALLRVRDNNCYRGNLSAILVDANEVELSKEDYLATYKEGADDNKLLYVGKVGNTMTKESTES